MLRPEQTARFLEALKSDSPIFFAYRKVGSDEIRIAWGTTHSAYIPEECLGGGDSHRKPKPANYKNYWDLGSDGWRCLDVDRLIWVENIGQDEKATIQELSDIQVLVDKFKEFFL